MQNDKFSAINVQIEDAIAWVTLDCSAAEPDMLIETTLRRLADDVLPDLTP